MKAARAAAIAASQAITPPGPDAASTSAPAVPPKRKTRSGATTEPKTKKKRRVFLELCCECGETQDSDYTVLVTKESGYVCCACYVYKALEYVAEHSDGDPEWPYRNPLAGPYYTPSVILDMLAEQSRAALVTTHPTQ
jgi:hypothetical protein